MEMVLPRERRTRSAVILLMAAAASTACNTPHYLERADEAYARGDYGEALQNYRKAQRYEGPIYEAGFDDEDLVVDGMTPGARVMQRQTESISRMAEPALEQAAALIEAGQLERAIDLLIPVHQGRVLDGNLTSGARERLSERARPLLEGAFGRFLEQHGQASPEALVTALNALRALIETSSAGEQADYETMIAAGGAASIEGAWEQMRARVGQQPTLGSLNQTIALAAALPGGPYDSQINAARLVVAPGYWKPALDLLAQGQEIAAVEHARRHAFIWPEAMGQKELSQIESRAAAPHLQKGQALQASYPGLAAAHFKLAERLGASVGGSRYEALARRWNTTNFQLENISGCSEAHSDARGPVTGAEGSAAIKIRIQMRCSSHDRTRDQHQTVTWQEQRVRYVQRSERYTAYESKRVCKMVEVYVNTSCSTRYEGNGVTKRTCTPNTNMMERCNNEIVPVERTRTWTEEIPYTVSHRVDRVIHHVSRGFDFSGTLQASWPEGSYSTSIRGSKSDSDSHYSDKAGSDPLSLSSLSSMRSDVVKPQVRSALEKVRSKVFATRRADVERKLQSAHITGDPQQAADLAMRAAILDRGLQARDRAALASLLEIPQGKVASYVAPAGSLPSLPAVAGASEGQALAPASITVVDLAGDDSWPLMRDALLKPAIGDAAAEDDELTALYEELPIVPEEGPSLSGAFFARQSWLADDAIAPMAQLGLHDLFLRSSLTLEMSIDELGWGSEALAVEWSAPMALNESFMLRVVSRFHYQQVIANQGAEAEAPGADTLNADIGWEISLGLGPARVSLGQAWNWASTFSDTDAGDYYHPLFAGLTLGLGPVYVQGVALLPFKATLADGIYDTAGLRWALGGGFVF